MELTIRNLIHLVKKEDIARRYFIMNSFDGALTIFGITIALYLAGIESARTVIISCVGAAVAMGVSGVWGAYAAERAERMNELKELERHLMRDLDETHVSRKNKLIIILVALVDGISPVLSSIIIITPFFFAGLNFISIETAYHMGFGLVGAILLVVGAIAGKIAKERMLPNAIKMLAAGLVVALLSITLEQLKVI